MPVLYQSEDIAIPKLKRRALSNWIKAVARKYDKKTGAIIYIFCSDNKILEINRQYLNHNYYTDIITFDYTEDNCIAGDLFISLDTVRSNSEQLGTIYEEELYRVMIHGVLHLCGFGDKTETEEQTMRQMEDEALIMRRQLFNEV